MVYDALQGRSVNEITNGKKLYSFDECDAYSVRAIRRISREDDA